MEEKQEKIGFFKKWYIYQKERFPVITFLFYVLCIVLGTFIIMNYCMGQGTIFFKLSPELIVEKAEIIKNPALLINYDSIKTIVVMLLCGFLQFLMVRIVDEFKDYEEDCKYRPYRPVPRGLISLTELKGLFVICFIAQVLLTYFFGGDFIALALLWVVFFLMTKGFFIKNFLDKHLIFEVVLDELMMPVMVIYLASFVIKDSIIWEILFNTPSYLGAYTTEWIEIGYKFQIAFLTFLILSYFCSCIAEVSRKIRSKDKEEKGVKTYTAVFGIPKATLLLSVIEICAFACQYVIIGQEKYLILFIALIIPLFCNIMFNFKPEHKVSKMVELMGNLYIAFSYLSMFLLYSGYTFIN